MAWTEANIRTAPEATGVYVLRDSQQTIIYVGRNREPRRLRERIFDHWQLNDVPGVAYFDWYQTRSEADAATLETAWIKEHQPRYNKQQK